MPSFVTPKKNTQYIFYISLVSQANTKIFQVNPTLAAADFNVATDDGAPAALGTTPVIDADFTRRVKVTLSAAEMNGDNVTLICSDSAGAEWCDLTINIQTTARQIDDLCYPVTSGRSLAVDASGRALTDLDTIKTNPVVNAGTVTFPTTATLASTTNITAGTVTTATNVTTVNGLAAGVITAASIAADAITDAKVAADVTIASVTGAVGSVTGAVGSVTGNVGGNVVGSVASVTAGVTVTTNNDKTGYGLSAAAVQAVWDALTTALTTVGSIGKKLADWTIGTAQTGDSFARLGAPAGASVSADIAAVKTDTAAIKTKTDSLTFTVAGQVDANIQSINDVALVGNGSGTPFNV